MGPLEEGRGKRPGGSSILEATGYQAVPRAGCNAWPQFLGIGHVVECLCSTDMGGDVQPSLLLNLSFPGSWMIFFGQFLAMSIASLGAQSSSSRNIM